MSSKKSLRYLWAYSAADVWTVAWHERNLKRRRERGFDVRNFCVTPQSLKRRWLPFPELDRRWRIADPALMQMYEELSESLRDREVLVLYNGANLHPEFVKWLSVIKVYTAGDDPESTEILTKPLAPAFDIHLVNNAACVQMYQGWGLKNVHFWPLGSMTNREDVSELTEQAISDSSKRPLPVVFFGERESPHRQQRLDKLAQAFPEALCAGRGWPRGFIEWDEMWSVYRKAQIGWNIHNSLGPVNFRTYELPAYGVMQICDNKSHLQQVYDVGREVIGFDSIEECIELTRYYLAHPEEQRQIAIEGRKRWTQDYTPDRVWDKLVAIVEQRSRDFLPAPPEVVTIRSELRNHSRRSFLYRSFYQIEETVKRGILYLSPIKRRASSILRILRNRK